VYTFGDVGNVVIVFTLVAEKPADGTAEIAEAVFSATIKYDTLLEANNTPKAAEVTVKSHVPLIPVPLASVPGADTHEPEFFLTYNRGTDPPVVGTPVASVIVTPLTTTLPPTHDAEIGEYVIDGCA
jgi:hypothetical protein